MLTEEVGGDDVFLPEADSHLVPVLPNKYFAKIEPHLRPSKDATVQQRYDLAVKLLIRDCSKPNIWAKANLSPQQRTGSFYLFFKTKQMEDFYKQFGHESIVFMDSGFRVNRSAFPITFISILDNFMKGRMVGVLISQFTDEQTYSISVYLSSNVEA